MKIVIDIPEKDVPSVQEIMTIDLHFISGEVCGCSYPYKVLPKWHGGLVDVDELKKDMQNYHEDCAKSSKYTRLGFETAIAVVEDAKPIIEADKEENK